MASCRSEISRQVIYAAPPQLSALQLGFRRYSLSVLAASIDPFNNIPSKVILAKIGVDLVICSLVCLVRLVIGWLVVEELLGRIIATSLIGSSVAKEDTQIITQLDRSRGERASSVQERGQSLQRASVVAQRIVAEVFDDSRITAQMLGRDFMFELLLRQQLSDKAAHENLDAAWRLVRREANEGRIEEPTANLLHQLRVARVRRKRNHLASPHGMAHYKNRHVGRKLVLDKSRDIRDDERGRAGQAAIRLLRCRLAPAPLIKSKDLDSSLA